MSKRKLLEKSWKPKSVIILGNELCSYREAIKAVNEMKLGRMKNSLEICERVRRHGNERTLMVKNGKTSRAWEVRALFENCLPLCNFKAVFATMAISNPKRNYLNSKLNKNNGKSEMHAVWWRRNA